MRRNGFTLTNPARQALKHLSDLKGFTLIELIIVVGIVGILSVSVLTVLNPFAQFAKSADARRKSDLSQIQKALETYYADNGKYPSNATSCSYAIKGNNGDANDCIEWGSSWPSYMNVVPADPSSNHAYVYYMPASSNGQSYYLYANLSRGKVDPQVCQNLNANGECQSVPAANLCGGPCNFAVSSPNVSP